MFWFILVHFAWLATAAYGGDQCPKRLQMLASTHDPFTELQVGDTVFMYRDGAWNEVKLVGLMDFGFGKLQLSSPGDASADHFFVPLMDLRRTRDSRPFGETVVLTKPRFPVPPSWIRRRLSPIPQSRSWVCDGEYPPDHFESYDASFWRAVGEMPIEQFLRRRKGHGKSTHVLDLFGSATFVRDFSVADSLTGARLEPGKVSFNDERWQEVIGDLTQRSTWQNLAKNRAARNIPGYDLITFRPIAGIDFLFPDGHPHTTSLAHYELNRMFQRALSALLPGGTMLIDLGSQIRYVYVQILLSELQNSSQYVYRVVERAHQADQPGYSSVLRIDRVDGE